MNTRLILDEGVNRWPLLQTIFNCRLPFSVGFALAHVRFRVDESWLISNQREFARSVVSGQSEKLSCPLQRSLDSASLAEQVVVRSVREVAEAEQELNAERIVEFERWRRRLISPKAEKSAEFNVLERTAGIDAVPNLGNV